MSRNPGLNPFCSFSFFSFLLLNGFQTGSLIPNYNILPKNTPRPEEAVLELACLHNQVDTLVICGHSDCKVIENQIQFYESLK
jgi:hypothetical protein